MRVLEILVLLFIVAFTFAQVTEEVPNLSKVSDFTGGKYDNEEGEPETLDFSAQCSDIYGKYCGPGWCAGKWWSGCPSGHDSSIPVANCDTNVPAKDSVDDCCRKHDACCIAARRTSPAEGECTCDHNIVSCLKSASCGGNWICAIYKSAIVTFFETRSKFSKSCC